MGNEIDVICDHGIQLDALEVKAGQTVAQDFFKGFTYLAKLTDTIRNSYIIYGGDKNFIQKGVQVTSWRNMSELAV